MSSSSPFCPLELLNVQDTKDRHALESTASLQLLQTHPVLALHLLCHGVNDLISTLCPPSLPLLLRFPTSLLSHAESFLCLENGFALTFTSAVSFFSKCLKISVHPVPASSVPGNHEVIEGKHSII